MSAERPPATDPNPSPFARPIEWSVRRSSSTNPELRLSRDGLGMPVAIWSDTPEPGAALSPSELRALAAIFLETADRLESDTGRAVASAQLALFDASSPERTSSSEEPASAG